MWTALISAFTDSLLKQAFALLSQELEKRQLIAAGKSEQYAADLRASVEQAKDAAVIREQVQASSDADLDAALNGVRNLSKPPGSV